LVHDLSQRELTHVGLCYKNITTPYDFLKLHCCGFDLHCCDFLQA